MNNLEYLEHPCSFPELLSSFEEEGCILTRLSRLKTLLIKLVEADLIDRQYAADTLPTWKDSIQESRSPNNAAVRLWYACMLVAGLDLTNEIFTSVTLYKWGDKVTI